MELQISTQSVGTCVFIRSLLEYCKDYNKYNFESRKPMNDSSLLQIAPVVYIYMAIWLAHRIPCFVDNFEC